MTKRGPELVADEGERAEPENGVRILPPVPDRATQGGLGAREVRRIGRFPPAQLEREAQLRQQAGVLRPGLHLGLERREWRCADAAGRSSQRPICERYGRGQRRCR